MSLTLQCSWLLRTARLLQQSSSFRRNASVASSAEVCSQPAVSIAVFLLIFVVCCSCTVKVQFLQFLLGFKSILKVNGFGVYYINAIFSPQKSQML